MLSHLLDTLTEILRQFTLGNTTTATVRIIFQKTSIFLIINNISQQKKNLEINKTCLNWGGNCLKKRVTAPVQAYFYLKSLAEFK